MSASKCQLISKLEIEPLWRFNHLCNFQSIVDLLDLVLGYRFAVEYDVLSEGSSEEDLLLGQICNLSSKEDIAFDLFHGTD